MARIIIPARARAWETDLVAAANVRKIADMTSIVMNVNRKNMKNGPASLLRPPRKYSIMLKVTAIRNLMGISATMPANASEKA